MMMEQLESIKLTETEKTIVEYLDTHQDIVSELTITDLAANTYTSNASIIRFCKKLGFKGYKDFLIQYVKDLESLRYTTREVNYDFPFTDGTPNEILQSLASLYKEASDLCLKHIDLSLIEKVVNKIQKARRVFIFAKGDTGVTSKAFINRLIKLGIYPILVNDEAAYMIENMNRNDCAILVSYGLASADFHQYSTMLLKKNVDLIVISANEKHSVSKNADLFIRIPQKEGNYKVSTFYSQFMFEFIYNLIYSRLYVCTKSSKKND